MEIDAVTIFRIQCAQIIWLVNTEWRLCLSLLPLCLKQAAKCGIQGWPFTVDLIYMQQCFNPELAICGRQLNQQLTTSLLRRPDFDDVGKMIKIVPAESTHKYIGPNLTAILYPRKIWNLFVVGGLSRTYCRLLGAYSPEQPHFVSFATTNSGLATLPLTMVCLQKLDHIRIFFLGTWVGTISWWPKLPGHTDANDPHNYDFRYCLDRTIGKRHYPKSPWKPETRTCLALNKKFRSKLQGRQMAHGWKSLVKFMASFTFPFSVPSQLRFYMVNRRQSYL